LTGGLFKNVLFSVVIVTSNKPALSALFRKDCIMEVIKVSSGGCGRGRGLAGAMAMAAMVVFGGFVGGAQAAGVESVGLKLGYNTAGMDMAYSTFDGNISWISRGAFSSSFGYHAGLSLNISISDIDLSGQTYIFGVNPMALFVSKGGENVRRITWAPNPNASVKYTVDAYYLDVFLPFAFKKNFDSYSVIVDVGPYASVGLFGEQKLTVKGSGVNHVYTQATFCDEGLTRADVGVFASAIVEFAEVFSVCIRYGSGFQEYSINSAALTLGYNIKL
jgi:hypothetical protein